MMTEIVVCIIGALIVFVVSQFLMSLILIIDSTLGSVSMRLKLHPIVAALLAMIIAYCAGTAIVSWSALLAHSTASLTTRGVFISGAGVAAIRGVASAVRLIERGILPLHLWVAALVLPAILGLTVVIRTVAT